MENQSIFKRKFSEETLNAILGDIREEYFKDDNELSFWEIVEYVKSLYSQEIDTLDNKTSFIRRGFNQ